MNRCIGLIKLVFAHDVFDRIVTGTKMRLELYVPKEGAFMPYVSYIDAANEVVLMYEG